MFDIRLAPPSLHLRKRLLTPITCLIVAAGCSDGGGTKVTGPEGTVPLTLRAVGTGAASGSGTTLSARAAGAAYVSDTGDTIPVTFSSALLVVRDVRFKLSDDGETDSLDTGDDLDMAAWDGDGGEHDSTGNHEGDDGDHDDGDDGDHDGEGMVWFRGPFVVDLLTQSAESLDTQMVLPGVYRRTMGHLRPLRADDWNASSYDYLIGSTVYLKGTVDGEGGGEFTYQVRINYEFKIRGEFTVEESTPATAFITFDISSWLRGRNGAFLDPRAAENDKLIRQAIIRSLNVGMDRNHNGKCDDRTHGEDD